MSLRCPGTVCEQICASYAHLSVAHILQQRSLYNKYGMLQKKYDAYRSGEELMRSLDDDEWKTAYEEKIPDGICRYCGSRKPLTREHLIPKDKGGSSLSHNSIPACQSCNSSKSSKDLWVWLKEKEKLPSILLWRRYLLLVARYCEVEGYMKRLFPADVPEEMPFELGLLPLNDVPHELIKPFSCSDRPASSVGVADHD